MPRNVAGNVVRGDDFWGRDQEVARLWALIDRGSVLLSAPRRYGKTSIMYALKDQPIRGWQVVQIDVEAIEHPIDLVASLLAEFAKIAPLASAIRSLRRAPKTLLDRVRGTVEEVGAAGFKLKLRDELRAEEWDELGEELLVAVSATKDRVLLILDEFPMMVSSLLDQNSPLAEKFLKWFRSQRQKNPSDGVRFLLGGSVNIEPRLESLGLQALLNDLERFSLQPFTRQTAVDFVQVVLGVELASEELAIPEGTEEKMVDVIDTGVPYFLQVLINEYIVERQRLGRPIALSEIEQIYSTRVLGPSSRARFSHYTTRLHAYYKVNELPARIILDELTKREDCQISILESSLSARGFGLEQLDETLMRLEGDYYLTRTGNSARFSSGFLRRWWTVNVPAPRRP